MNKFTRLKAAHLEARKAKDLIASNLLSTLKGEVETYLKGSEELPEDVVEKVAQKFKKNLESAPTKESEYELEILKPFLREQISEDEIISRLNLLNLKEMPNFGAKMGAAMLTFKGQVDGNLLSNIIRKNF